MSVFRGPVLAIANRPFVEKTFRQSRFTEGLVSRFVAGETLDTAFEHVRPLTGAGLVTTFDELGENVSTEAEAAAAVDSYVHLIKRMAAQQLEPNISIKLTMLGLDLGDDLVRANVQPILTAAREVKGFVRVDMEGSLYTQRTMNLFSEFHDAYPDEVGIVIQTYLKRAADDIEAMIARKARVRLVKGAYSEPEKVAYQDKAKIDENYRVLMQRLLADGRFPAIATHDPALIEATRTFARQNRIPNENWEFQMLYGVRRDEQIILHNQGYGMRVYVPYGTQWYPYFTRRIAERPANAFFVLRQFFDR